MGDYSKMHLYTDMDEHVPFANGDKTEVYDTELGRLGMMICYDIRFCELARTYALKKGGCAGGHLRLSQSQGEPLAHPSDRPRHREPDVRGGLQPGGPQPYGDLLRPLHHHRPWGDIIAEGGGEEEIITGSIDYTKTREVRDLIHMFRDRQPTLYGDTLLRPVD